MELSGHMKNEPWRLLLDPIPGRGAWNMGTDEAILDACSRGESLPTLRLYAWDPACLSIGYAQPIEDVDVNHLKIRGWELVRRPTGGKAVLHIDELTYSVIARIDEPRVAGTVLESYNRLAQALVEALRLINLQVEVKEHIHNNERNNNPVCFEMPSTYEIMVGGKKLIGSAQTRRKDGVLQHGSLPLRGDLTRILDVLEFPDETSRRLAAERLLAHATTVETALGIALSWETVAQAFIHAFGSVLNMDLQPANLTSWEKSTSRELVEEKYAHPGWTQKPRK
jgi:lipoate-protein ligase A